MNLRTSVAWRWLPAAVLATATVIVLSAYGTPAQDVAIFAGYVIFGLALPGMLWVRLLRRTSSHLAEDLALGLAVGYCLELVAYLAARAIGLPLLFLVWVVVTYVVFATPNLRRYWRGSGERVPTWWSWALAAMLAYVLIFSAGSFFQQHHLTGSDTPYVDMPYHLALIGELKHHLPPLIPYVSGVPLAYHWFVYADSAAVSWATGIEPATLLYRLFALPMFVVFVLLTAVTARRLTGGWGSGPVAVAVAMFGSVAAPYRWADGSVFDTQTLLTTWMSPTNLFGLALFAAAILMFVDLLQADSLAPRTRWLVIGLLVFGVAGAKATLLPLLIVGLATVLVGDVISRRRLHKGAVGGLAVALIGLIVATTVLYRGESVGLAIGLGALRSFPVAVAVGAQHASGAGSWLVPLATLSVAIMFWSFLWAGAYGLIARRRATHADPSILLLVGVCAAALGAVSVFLYPGLSQLYYLRGAAGAFGLVTATGVWALLPAQTRRGPLIAAVSVAALLGTGIVMVIRALTPSRSPTLGHDHLPDVLPEMILPVLALGAAVLVAYVVASRVQRRVPTLQGAVPLTIVALAMAFSVPGAVRVIGSPFTSDPLSDVTIPSDGITAARWLRDHSDPADLVATNMHCNPGTSRPDFCDARHFWVSAYAERRMLVEGWGYTPAALDEALRLDVRLSAVPFWDQPLLTMNDQAFTEPSAASLAELRDRHGVRWLFADGAGADPEALGRYADLRFRSGDFSVYELR